MGTTDVETRLAAWLSTQLPEARGLRIEGVDHNQVGHSAETLLLTIVWSDAEGDHRRDVAVRIRPPAPGLLEPYDLERQFTILRALEPTPVRSPAVFWFEGSGDVLGRPFYVMERLAGTVYESYDGSFPEEIKHDPARARRMSESMLDQIATIHLVDLQTSGLGALADGRDYVDRELDHWGAEIARVKRGPLPALEQLEAELRRTQPEPCPSVTLIHGDPKPGNFAFEGGDVSAVYDWEMAGLGDPRADLGWAEVVWSLPGSITQLPGAPSTEELLAEWEARTGIATANRPWYRALEAWKMATIQLVGSQLFDRGASDDLRLAYMGYAVRDITRIGLRELGLDEDLDTGPVRPRKERILEVRDTGAKE